MSYPPAPGAIVHWQIGAHDQLGRVVLIEERFAFAAMVIAQRWLSSRGLPSELAVGNLTRHKSRGTTGAGLLVVRDRDGELEERTLTTLEIES